MKFLENKPTTFSKRQVHRIGSALRNGESVDEEQLGLFLDQQSALCESIIQEASQTMTQLDNQLTMTADSIVEPDSDRYFLSSRVKTRDTLREKLSRMPSFPLENIQDVSGVRMDVDVTLKEQTVLAKLLSRELVKAGARKVILRDMREEPHSGYRAVHLHVMSEAGRAEFQLRTALQSQWANLYEMAGDLYGREIRYLEFGGRIPAEFEIEIRALHEVSEVVNRVEKLVDILTEPFEGSRPVGATQKEARQLRRNMYKMLDKLIHEFEERRVQRDMEGE
ncbi:MULTISPECIES: nucleotidyltransferase family protein [Corynebacterium]|uniref:hypothetical protein n=1 Tax=Corynebacterium sp. HMSC055A01 TaxID=1715083 RepID=UPI0008A54319|nr:hypothetical protein [Corynebacterium sp. HMSC055A01]OFN17089.1 hypothetical protein HMPREF2604_09375 [Corynebacterium sp. HMSC055A01]